MTALSPRTAKPPLAGTRAGVDFAVKNLLEMVLKMKPAVR